MSIKPSGIKAPKFTLRRSSFAARQPGVTVKPISRGPGRPKVGDFRLECMVPKAVWNELLRREQAGQGYRTRIAADILTIELIGHINSPGDSSHQRSISR